MLTVIALVVFVLVALLVFVVGSFLDQRSAQARMLRDRLATVQKAEQQTGLPTLGVLLIETGQAAPAEGAQQHLERLPGRASVEQPTPQSKPHPSHGGSDPRLQQTRLLQFGHGAGTVEKHSARSKANARD